MSSLAQKIDDLIALVDTWNFTPHNDTVAEEKKDGDLSDVSNNDSTAPSNDAGFLTAVLNEHKLYEIDVSSLDLDQITLLVYSGGKDKYSKAPTIVYGKTNETLLRQGTAPLEAFGKNGIIDDKSSINLHWDYSLETILKEQGDNLDAFMAKMGLRQGSVMLVINTKGHSVHTNATPTIMRRHAIYEKFKRDTGIIIAAWDMGGETTKRNVVLRDKSNDHRSITHTMATTHQERIQELEAKNNNGQYIFKTDGEEGVWGTNTGFVWNATENAIMVYGSQTLPFDKIKKMLENSRNNKGKLKDKNVLDAHNRNVGKQDRAAQAFVNCLSSNLLDFHVIQGREINIILRILIIM